MSTIENNVMATVHTIYAARKLITVTAFKAYVLVAAIVTLWKLVWVTRVEENFLQVANGGVLAMGNFILSAITHTSLLVQLILFIGAFAFFLFVRDITHSRSTLNLA